MKKIKSKRISAMISVLLVLTMMFGTGSVFANGGYIPPNPLKSIYVTDTYVKTSVDSTVYVNVIACYKLDAGVVSSSADWKVDHKNILDVYKGRIQGKEKGVATITVTYGGLEAQVVVEVV